MAFEVVQSVTDNLIPTLIVSGIHVIHCGRQGMASGATSGARCSITQRKEERHVRKSAFPLLLNEEFSQSCGRTTLTSLRRPDELICTECKSIHNETPTLNR